MTARLCWPAAKPGDCVVNAPAAVSVDGSRQSASTLPPSALTVQRNHLGGDHHDNL